MRFNCDRRREAKEKKRREKLYNWHRRFAWLPVKIQDAGICLWLEYYETKYHDYDDSMAQALYGPWMEVRLL